MILETGFGRVWMKGVVGDGEAMLDMERDFRFRERLLRVGDKEEEREFGKWQLCKTRTQRRFRH